MSLDTWTPAALSSERRRVAGRCWRVVEAQHRVSTLKLVDTVAEQELLEEVLDGAKPPLPPECRHLHYLLATPFRYGAPYPTGSRFRRPGLTPGVYYASALVATAVAEMAFHRLLFFADSPATPWPANAGEYTAFSVDYRGAALDLTRPPLDADAALWLHTTDYAAPQALAERARSVAVTVLRYASVRDPVAARRNVALLNCRAFGSTRPLQHQTWRLHFSPAGVHAVCGFPEARLEFGRATFAADPRIASLNWDR